MRWRLRTLPVTTAFAMQGCDCPFPALLNLAVILALLPFRRLRKYIQAAPPGSMERHSRRALLLAAAKATMEGRCGERAGGQYVGTPPVRKSC